MHTQHSTGTKITATSPPPAIARPAASALHVARHSSSTSPSQSQLGGDG